MHENFFAGLKTYRVSIPPNSKPSAQLQPKKLERLPSITESVLGDGELVDPNEFDLPAEGIQIVTKDKDTENVESAIIDDNRQNVENELEWLNDLKSKVLSGQPCVTVKSVQSQDVTNETKELKSSKTILQATIRQNAQKETIQELLYLLDAIHGNVLKLIGIKMNIAIRLSEEFCKTAKIGNVEQIYERVRKLFTDLTADATKKISELLAKEKQIEARLKDLKIPSLDDFMLKLDQLYSIELQNVSYSMTTVTKTAGHLTSS
jgi:hypothetical protein